MCVFKSTRHLWKHDANIFNHYCKFSAFFKGFYAEFLDAAAEIAWQRRQKELSGKHRCVKCTKTMGTEGIPNRYINFQSAQW